MCTQEWERFCAFFCMVFKVPELRAQIFDGSVMLSTRAKQKDDGMCYSYLMMCSNMVQLQLDPLGVASQNYWLGKNLSLLCLLSKPCHPTTVQQ